MSDPENKNLLAIVIPAFKQEYLDGTLRSFVNQTRKDFVIYIGDDASPYNLKEIVSRYDDLLSIRYHRFDNNIGARNLVNQWTRCIELTKGEPWLWLFSDDDLADPNCVEQFYKTLEKNADRFDVYRFNTKVIDKTNKLLFDTPVGPAEESAELMGYHLLKGERGNSMPDHIFSRSVYTHTGGFVYTDYAQGADWATSIKFAGEKGIAIIPDAMVSWRLSGSNISSVAAGHQSKMVRGHLQFLDWILRRFDYLKDNRSTVTYEMMQSAIRTNIHNVFINHYKGLTFNTAISLFSFMLTRMKLPFKTVLKDLHAIDVRTRNRLAIFSRFKRLFVSPR